MVNDSNLPSVEVSQSRTERAECFPRPVAEIPAPVFKELPSLEIQKYESGEHRSDSYDEDFEIEDDSVRKGFDQLELNDLARDLGLSIRASELLASREKLT
ncbi:hypothetical protein QE152_g31482 [Popillia japonica]|uniref:Uncharacterized protein n=1 Tax=Popillia japonica TaxID=7064 RepID=A0AAW1J167_POPJA